MPEGLIPVLQGTQDRPLWPYEYCWDMTIGIAWIRQGPDSKELWIASDSRLSGNGYIWDSCSKLSTMPRRDVVMGFAGGTQEALPLMNHLTNAVASYRALNEGILEFFHFVGHLELVINDMMGSLIVDPAVRSELPFRSAFSSGSDTIVLAGYSRRSDDFIIRFLQYQPDINRWVFGKPAPFGIEDQRDIHLFGDGPAVAHVDTAIGMTTSIGDDAARSFAAQLYSSIAESLSLQVAFEQAKLQINLVGLREDQTPKIFSRPGVDIRNLVLLPG